VKRERIVKRLVDCDGKMEDKLSNSVIVNKDCV